MTTNAELVDRFQAAWSARDFAQDLAATCAPDLHYEDPLTFEPLVGPAALARHVARLRTGAPDARLEATGERLTDGRFVAAPARLLATHSGQCGIGLTPGQWISSGAVTGVHPVAPGALVEAIFDGTHTVSCTIEAATGREDGLGEVKDGRSTG